MKGGSSAQQDDGILEERQEIPNFGSDGKAKAAVFDSEALRFEKERQRSPGPC